MLNNESELASFSVGEVSGYPLPVLPADPLAQSLADNQLLSVSDIPVLSFGGVGQGSSPGNAAQRAN